MKKFTFALTAVAFAVCANAASINWGASKGYLYDGADSPEKVTSGTAYLVSTGLSQTALVAIFMDAAGDTSATLTSLQGNANYLGSGTVGDNARIDDGTGTTSAEQSITTYFVVFNGGKMYVSGTADSEYDGLQKEHSIAFANMSSSSKTTIDASTSGGYTSAGWYSVPEPTTVALLALGLVAAGLKRKVA